MREQDMAIRRFPLIVIPCCGCRPIFMTGCRTIPWRFILDAVTS